MSVVETRPETIPFARNWIGKPQEQVAEELASYSLETKRIPDPYYFTADKDGDLFHPQARAKVNNFIVRDTYVGGLEGQAFDAISSWFRQNDTGAIVWVSPPAAGIYPTSKIIISEIENNREKRLYNRAIVLDFDEERCLQFAQDLANFSKDHPLLQSLDQVRATPLALNTQGGSWIYILQELIDDHALWEGIKEGKDEKAKQEALVQARLVHQRLFREVVGPEDGQRMMIEMLGEKMGSCPIVLKTAFGAFSAASSLFGISTFTEADQYGSLHFECGKCNRTNRRSKGELLANCQHCGASTSC